MSIIKPNAGDIFRCIVKHISCYFQIIAECDYSKCFIIRTAPLNTQEVNDNPIDFFTNENNPDKYAYSYLLFGNPFEFHSCFELISNHIPFDRGDVFRPEFVLFPKWRGFSSNFIPPMWIISELEYINDYARVRSSFVTQLPRVPLPDYLHNSIFCKKYNHGQYMLGLRHPYNIDSPSPGVFVIRDQINKWTKESIKLWNTLFENRYIKSNLSISEESEIATECKATIFNVNYRLNRSENILLNQRRLANLKKRKQQKKHSYHLESLREDATKLYIYLRDVLNYKRDKLRVIRNIINELLHDISRKKNDENNLRKAIAKMSKSLIKYNDTLDNNKFGEDEKMVFTKFLTRVEMYVEVTLESSIAEIFKW